MPPQLARYWIGTIQQSLGWTVPEQLTAPLVWLRGQEEIGASGNRHWQILATFSKQVRLRTVTTIFEGGHWEVTRSRAAEEYVWKDDTAVTGTRFELGSRPMQRNRSTDWDVIRANAKEGQFDEIPADIYGMILHNHSSLLLLFARNRCGPCYACWYRQNLSRLLGPYRNWQESACLGRIRVGDLL